jgi:hypothetical protein
MDDQRDDREDGKVVNWRSLLTRNNISAVLIAMGLGVFALGYYADVQNPITTIGGYAVCTVLVGYGLGNFFCMPMLGVMIVFAIEIFVFLHGLNLHHIVGFIFPTT